MCCAHGDATSTVAHSSVDFVASLIILFFFSFFVNHISDVHSIIFNRFTVWLIVNINFYPHIDNIDVWFDKVKLLF